MIGRRCNIVGHSDPRLFFNHAREDDQIPLNDLRENDQGLFLLNHAQRGSPRLFSSRPEPPTKERHKSPLNSTRDAVERTVEFFERNEVER